MFALVVMATTNCSQADSVRTAEENLLRTLQNRFDENKYISSKKRVNNPYDNVGKQAKNLMNKVTNSISKYRAANNASQKSSSVFRLASYKLTSENTNTTLGIANPEELAIVSKIISDHNPAIAPDKINMLNNELTKVELTEMRGLKILDNAVEKGTLSPLQKDLMVLHYQEISKAKSKDEIIAISNTYESEIVVSKIDELQKKELLVNCSLVRHLVLENASIGDLTAKNASFKLTAAVVPVIINIIIAAAATVVTYELARGFASVLCPTTSTSSYQECVDGFSFAATAFIICFA